jgi:hypothetical protein
MIKPMKRPETRICKSCGKEFVPEKRNRSRQVSCSIRCWQDKYNREHDIAGQMRELRRRQRVSS